MIKILSRLGCFSILCCVITLAINADESSEYKTLKLSKNVIDEPLEIHENTIIDGDLLKDHQLIFKDKGAICVYGSEEAVYENDFCENEPAVNIVSCIFKNIKLVGLKKGSIGGYLNDIVFQNVECEFCGDCSLSCKIESDCVIGGNGFTLSNSYLNVGAGAKLTLQNLKLDIGRKSGWISCSDYNGRLILKDVVVELDKYYNWSGELEVHNDVCVGGSGLFMCTGKSPVAIKPNSSLVIDPEIILLTNTSIDLEDKKSMLYLNGCVFSLLKSFDLKKGTLVVDKDVLLDTSASEDGISFGDGLSKENDLNIELLSRSQMQLGAGKMTFKNVIA